MTLCNILDYDIRMGDGYQQDNEWVDEYLPVGMEASDGKMCDLTPDS